MNELEKTGVYEIVHNASGKRYVGSTAKSFKARWRLHRLALSKGKHHSVLLQRAWNKYGAGAFEFRVVEFTNPEHAIAIEQTFLDWRKSANPKFGYNIAPTAGNTLGLKWSNDSRAAKSTQTKNYLAGNPIAREQHSDRMKKFYDDNPCAREKMSAAKKKYHAENPGDSEKHSQFMKNLYANDPCSVEKQSARIKKYYAETPGSREKNSRALKEYYANNPDALNECSERTKSFYVNNPDAGKKHSERLKKFYDNNPAARLAAAAKSRAIHSDPVRKASWLAKFRATLESKKLAKAQESA